MPSKYEGLTLSVLYGHLDNLDREMDYYEMYGKNIPWQLRKQYNMLLDAITKLEDKENIYARADTSTYQR